MKQPYPLATLTLSVFQTKANVMRGGPCCPAPTRILRMQRLFQEKEKKDKKETPFWEKVVEATMTLVFDVQCWSFDFHTVTLSHFVSRSLVRSLILYLSISHPLLMSHSRSNLHSHALSLYFTLSLSLSLTFTLSILSTLSLTISHSLNLSNSLSLSLTLSNSL